MLRRFVQGVGDDKSDVGKTVKGLKGVADITRTVVEKAGEFGELLGTPGLVG